MNLDRTPLPRFWYLPRGEKAAVVLTGDDHGHAGTIGQFNRYAAGERGRLLGRRLAVRAVDVLRLSRHRHHRRPGAGLPGRRLRDRPAPEHRLRRLHAGLARGRLGDAAPRVRRRLPQPVRPADQPDALHRLERLGQRAEGRAQPRRPPRHQLLLLARGVGPGPARHVHRLGLPDALRRRGRLADRRLPGGDAAHRRVGASTSTATSRRCSTAPWAPTATTASSPPTCTPTTTTTRAPTPSSPRPRRAACRSSRPCRCSTGSTAATTRPSGTSATTAPSCASASPRAPARAASRR